MKNKLAGLAALALLFWSCGQEQKKNADTADTAHDGHDHTHAALAPEKADSIISAAGVSGDTVNMIALPTVYEGDIVFQVNKAPQCVLAGKADGFKYNHAGLIFIRPKNNEYVVMEAFDTTRLVSLREWVNRGENGGVLILRLKNANRNINEKKLDRLKKAARQFHKVPYDPYFGWSDDALYAPELIWKVYHEALALRLCDTRKFSTLDLSSPDLKNKLKEKYGASLPQDQEVVTLKDIAGSPLLEKIFER